jgi:hypothetical protein
MRHNPTPLRVGMSGAFVGKNYRIAGRIVLSMEEAGETYYWNEFHLIGDDGKCATLVFEQTEKGPEWKMFTLLEPAPPMSAAEAALKRVGDQINFEGRTLSVTCVDESRVCEIEGEAPEGVEHGDIAHYFNAESGHEMIVVSWTGEEVEFYRGLNIPARAVSSAFGVSAVPSGALSYLGQSHDEAAGEQRKGKFIIALMVLALAWFAVPRFGCNPVERAERPPKLPPAELSIGSVGKLNALQYHITGHAIVEVARVGKRFLRHEYSVVDEAGNEAILWQGTEQGASKWMLAMPFTPSQPLTPTAAGALRLGQAVNIRDTAENVTDLFLARIGKVEGAQNWPAGTELYGFAAQAPKAKEMTVALWDGSTLNMFRAVPTTDSNPAKSFR